VQGVDERADTVADEGVKGATQFEHNSAHVGSLSAVASLVCDRLEVLLERRLASFEEKILSKINAGKI